MKVDPEPGCHVCELLLLQMLSVRIKAYPLLANLLSKTFRESSDSKETQLGTKNNKTVLRGKTRRQYGISVCASWRGGFSIFHRVKFVFGRLKATVKPE